MIDPLSGIPANVDVQPDAKKLLRRVPASVRALLVEILDVMERSAQEYSAPVVRMELIAERDPEDGTEKVVVRQWVRTSHETAMDYWAKVGRDIDGWVRQLPEPAADQVGEWVAFVVHPEANDAAA